MKAADSPFRHRAFQLYCASRVASLVAMQIEAVAVGWQLYALTGSVLDLGLAGLVTFVPALLLTIPAGSLVDRLPRQRVLACALGFKALCMLVLALASWQGWIGREVIFVLSALLGCARAFEMPAHSALLAHTVPPALLPAGVAWSSMATQGGIIVGPALGGLVYLAGAHIAHACSALAGLAATVLIAAIRTRPVAHASGPGGLAFLFGGLRFIRGQPVVLGAMSLDMVSILLGGAAAMLPVYASDILHTDAGGVGLLRAAEGIGSLLAALVLVRFPLRRRVGRLMFATVMAFGAATALFALSRTFWLSFAALLLSGAAEMVTIIIRTSLIQIDTPDAMRGRVGAVGGLSIGASRQLGDFRAGAMAAAIGVVPAVLAGGIGSIVVALVWMRLFPALARRDALERRAA